MHNLTAYIILDSRGCASDVCHWADWAAVIGGTGMAHEGPDLWSEWAAVAKATNYDPAHELGPIDWPAIEV